MGHLPQMVLPLLQRLGIAVVHLHGVKQARGATALQPRVHLAPKAAKVGVLPVAQRQQAVAQVRQMRLAGQGVAGKGGGVVGRVALAAGADHPQRASRLGQRLG